MMAWDTLAERVSGGESLTEADAATILAAPDLIAIGMLGDAVRRRLHGSRTTFVRVFELHVSAPPPALPGDLQAGELRVVGRPESLDAALAAVRAAAALAGAVPLTGFSLSDLQSLAGATVDSLETTCGRLRDAGLQAIAETPIDRMANPGEAVETARRAGLAVLRLTVQSLAEDARIAMVLLARDLQARLGGFAAFAPLPRSFPVGLPSTGYDDVKQVALARVMASNIPSVQVDWALYGPKLAQVALTTGADDIDGARAFDPDALGTRRSAIEEIRGNIRAAGLDGIERNGLFAALEAGVA